MYELYDPCTVMFFYRSVIGSAYTTPQLIGEFARNKHIMIDLGTGNNNKMYVVSSDVLRVCTHTIRPSVTGQWITSKRYAVSGRSKGFPADSTLMQMIDIIETVYRGASKGRGLVVSPKGMACFRTFSWRPSTHSLRVITDYSTRYRY